MVVVDTGKRFGLTTQEVWFATPSDNLPERNRTIYYQAQKMPEKGVYSANEFHTLVIDLDQSEDEIHAGISRTFKYHIRKVQKFDLNYRLINLRSLEERATYLQSYNAFADRKKIFKLTDWRLNAFIQSGALQVTVVEQNGVPITFHAYIHDNNRARLLTSHATIQGLFDESETSFCNKYHHWCDIKHFKRTGFRWYDFGGVSKDEENGRNYFKKSFGGRPQVFYHFITCTGILRLWFELRRLL